MGRDSPTAIQCDEDKSSTCTSEAESDDVNDSEVSHAGMYEFSKKLHQGLYIIICRWTGNARAALLQSTHIRYCNHRY